jgi:nicotinate-nucleotide adenylyltransferase
VIISLAIFLKSDYAPVILLIGVFFMDKKKILLYGGTFNPIHNGHLWMAQEAIERLSFNEVIFIPSATPPHKEDVLSFSHRLKMTQLATEGVDFFSVSDIESKREGPSYTYDTVMHFKKEFPDAKIYWMVGTDTVKELKDWYRISDLMDECRFIVAERNPYRNYDWEKNIDYITIIGDARKAEDKKYGALNYFTPLINDVMEISSTDIRHRVKHKTKYAAKFLIPKEVEKYIYENEIYKTIR